jgi:hypothetical protein
MIKPLVFVLLGTLAFGAAAAKDSHVILPSAPQNGAVSTDAMDVRLEAAANDDHGTINRVVFFDAALPRDAGEYVDVAGYSIVLFMALSRDPAELPLARAFVRVAGKDVPLTRISQFQRDIGDGMKARETFGQTRVFAYYLVPTAALMTDHELVCDFARGEKGFIVDRQVADAPDYLTPQVAAAAAQARPSLAAVRAFLTREYPGTALDVAQKDLP